MTEWLKDHAWWLAGCSLLITLLTSVGGIAVLVRMPEDHFVRREKHRHIVLTVLRNIVGAVLIVAGVVLSLPLVPGPGFILLIAGISLMNFPGRRRLLLRLLRMPWVLKPINRLRGHFGQPPLRMPVRSKHRVRGEPKRRDGQVGRLLN
jgi:hypothetical protein